MVPFSGAGSVLVGPHQGGVRHHLPVDLPNRVRAGLGMGQQPLPGVVVLPAAEPFRAGLPGTIAFRQVPPGTPVASFQRMPLTTRRWSAHWPPGRPVTGSRGAISAQA
jgi:hypothetical protein